jgi:hypothetical protein
MSAAGQPDYIVSTRYEVEDASTKAMQRIRGETVDLQRSTRNLQLGVAGLTAAYFAARGAMNSFLGLKSKLIDYNENIKASTIGLAAMLTGAAKLSGSDPQEKFFRAMKAAPEIVDDLRKTAAAGIGELRDYMGGFNILVVPLMQAGLKAKNIVEITKLLVPISKTLRYDMAFASMDVQQMVLGRATMADRLPKYLGLSVHEMNKLARTTDGASKVIKVVTEKLRTWAPAAEQFGLSFSAQMDTLNDSISELWGKTGVGMSDAAKKALIRVNEYLSKNKSRIDDFLDDSGKKFADSFGKAFDSVFETTIKIAEHWDTIYETAKKILTVYLAIKAASLAVSGGRALVGGIQAAGGIVGSVRSTMQTINAGQSFSHGMFSGVSSGLAMMGAGANVPPEVAAAMLNRLAGPGAMGVTNPVAQNLSNFARSLGMASSAADKFGKAVFTGGMLTGALALGGALGTLIDELFDISSVLERGWSDLTTLISGGEVIDREDMARRVEARKRSGAQQPIMDYLALTPFGLGGAMETAATKLKEFGAKELSSRTFQDLDPAKQEAISLALLDFADAVRSGSKDLYALNTSKEQWSMLERVAVAIESHERWFNLPEGILTQEHISRIKGWGAGDIEGAKTQVKNDFRGSKFEVKVDARDKDPDAIAFVFAEMVHKQVEFQTRSSMAPPLSP